MEPLINTGGKCSRALLLFQTSIAIGKADDAQGGQPRPRGCGRVRVGETTLVGEAAQDIGQKKAGPSHMTAREISQNA